MTAKKLLHNSLEGAPRTLPDLYKLARDQVYQELEQKKKIVKLSNFDKVKLSKNPPPCVSYILKEMPENSEQVNFNKLVLVLITYFQMAEWGKEDAWAQVQGFVTDYPHSDTYNTPAKRADHWHDEWDYLKGQADYKFACSYVKGLGLPNDAFSCSACIGEKKPSDFSSEKILKALNQNEDGDARILIELFSKTMVYDHAAGRWYTRRKGGHWQEDLIDKATATLKKVVLTYVIEVKRQQNRQITAEQNERTKESKSIQNVIDALFKRIRDLQTRNRKANVLKLAAAGEGSLGISGLEWDRNLWLLGCKNGIIDLRTGELKSVDPKAYIKTVAPTKWAGLDAPCPAWERFLSDIFNKDEKLINFCQRLFGYALIGKDIEHIFTIFWGDDGRNGKDTLFETFYHVLGDYATPVQSELFLSQKYDKQAGAPTPELMRLRGKRIVGASETEKTRRLNLSKVKFLTGGSTITARHIYGRREVSFPPTFTLFLCTNHKPVVPHVNDSAFWERLIMIPLTQRFVKNPSGPNEHAVDLFMKDKLKMEASGVLSWLTKGCLDYQKNGLNPPDIVKKATDEYKSDSDQITRYADECLVRAPRAEVRAMPLYEDYLAWGKRTGESVMSSRAFFLEIGKKFPKTRKTRTGRFYIGIGLKKE